VNGPLKWHGGKHYLAKRIVALMPPHIHYVEPYAGGLAVLLAKDPEGISEVVNDVDHELMNFWYVLKNEELFPEFVRVCRATPFSERDWREAVEGVTIYTSLIGRAWAFFVRCRQSLAGRMKSFAPLSRTRTRRGMNEQAAAWLSAVEGLPAVHERLRRVVVLNRDALDVIKQQDGPDTLFYLDPPYMSDTRSSPNVYAHEMTEQQHADLLALLASVKGKFCLSGYRCGMYDAAAAGKWHRTEFDLPNNSASGDTKQRRTECLWANFPLPNSG
jgi:DNA adenine methylase